uniref:Filamin-A n=1 Tax=Syphacia muris TaxID=451379 RepID=A0A0N5AN33_9BILA
MENKVEEEEKNETDLEESKYISQLHVLPTVDAVEAGKGQLEISVNQGQVPNNVQMQGAGRCLVTFIPQFPGQYVIDVTFNGEQVYGCPIRVDIQQKHVGQNISTPIITDQTVDHVNTSYKSDAMVCTTSDKREVPVSPSLMRSVQQQRNAELSGYEHPKSPSLLQKCEMKSSVRKPTITSMNIFSTLYDSANFPSSSPKPWNSPYSRTATLSPLSGSGRDRESGADSSEEIRRSDSATMRSGGAEVVHSSGGDVGYTVAHYGDEKPHTVSSHTYTDNGNGTVTSTYTSETRYGNNSPTRTFEYMKDSTISTLPGEVHDTLTTSYEEINTYEVSRKSPVNSSAFDKFEDLRSVTPEKENFERMMKSNKSSESEFVTDNKCYGFTDAKTELEKSNDFDDASFSSKRHRFFGEDGEFKGAEKVDKSDVGVIRTIYEKSTKETIEQIPGDKIRMNELSTGVYTSSEFTPSKIFPSDATSGFENDNREPAHSSSFGACVKSTRKLDDSLEKFPPPPVSSTQHQPVVKEYLPESTIGRDQELNNGERMEIYTTPREIKSDRADNKFMTSESTPHAYSRDSDVLNTKREKKNETVKAKISKSTEFLEKHPAVHDHQQYEKTFQDTHTYEKEPSYQHYETVDYGKKGSEGPEVTDEFQLHSLHRTDEMERIPLLCVSDETTQGEYGNTQGNKNVDETRTKLSSRLSFELVEPEGNISSSVVEEAVTPGGFRRTDEKRDEELDDAFELDKSIPPIQVLEKVEQLPHSKPPSTATTPKTTPRTTPRLNLKFTKDSKDKEKTPFDFGKSKFTSKYEIIRKGKDVEVKLESLKLGKEDNLKIVVIPPAKPHEEGAEIEPRVKKSRHTYEISFRPNEVGTHKIMAYVNGILHPLSPFPIRVYDASEIIVGAITPQSTTNDTVEFTVDAGRAGFGNLEMAIKDSEGVIIPSHVAQLETGTAKFLVTFNPTTVGMHTVNITFNKEVLKNSPFEVMIVEPKSPDGISGSSSIKKKDSKKEEKKRIEKEKPKKEKDEKQESSKKSKVFLKSVLCNFMDLSSSSVKDKDSKRKKHASEQKTTITTIPSLSRVNKSAVILVNVSENEELGVVVTGMNFERANCITNFTDPYKHPVESKIVDHDTGVKKVVFTPTCVGDHEIDIKYGGVDVQGSPFTCRAYDPAKIAVGEMPNGVTDQIVHFIVDASDAGVGNLEVAINDGHVPSMAQSLGQHRYDISFVPREEIDHTISVRFNNEPVPGSPFTCHVFSPHTVAAFGQGLERVPVGQVSKFFLSAENKDHSAAPVVNITDVHGEQIPTKVYFSPEDEKYVVEYIPIYIGNHQIEIKYDGEPISGSPFTAKAYDANCARLTCVESAVVGKPCTFTIDAARAGAGNMEIIVSVENRNVPNFVQAEGQAKFKVSFTPQEAKEHIISVRFNGQPIPGSPMTCPVSEALERVAHTTQNDAVFMSSKNQQIRLIGDLSTAQVGQVKGFSIDTAGQDVDCVVVVTDANGKEVSIQLEKVLDGYHVQFMPIVSGDHQINIELDGTPLGICPIIIEVGHSPQVSRLPPVVIVGKKLAFEVDTGRNGQGDLNVRITDDNGYELPVTTEIDNRGLVRANCRFRNKGHYTVEVFLDGKLVREPQYINVISPSSGARIISNMELGRVGEPFKVAIRTDPGIAKYCNVILTDPQGNQVPVSLRDVASDTIEAEFVPKLEGSHSLAIKVSDEHVEGSPFRVSVLDLSTVRVIGLKNDRVGIEQRFNVDWSNSGGNEANVRITRENIEVPCSVKKVKPGLYVCSFTPKQAGLHLIDVMIDGILLPECPYECIINDTGTVRARGDALTRAQRGKTARFEVSLSNAVRGELDVIITDPRGSPLSVRCYKQQDDSYWVEFTPEEIGSHRIEILFADVAIPGSPFKCEVVDPRKVIVKGTHEVFPLRQPANIFINKAEAGNGTLQVDVVDPTGQFMKVDMLKSPNGDEKVSFLPLKPGNYKLNARLSGFQVQGTPHTIVVEEQKRLSIGGSAVEKVVEVNQEASIIFDSKKAKNGMKVDVKGPKGNKVRHTANKRSDGTTEILFTPTEVGQYVINVDSNNKPIAGSPFAVEVVDSHKVIIDDENVDDNNLLHLAVQQRNIINVDATAAGNGNLRVEACNAEGDFVDGCTLESLGYGKYRIIFVPQYIGEYKIYLYWSEIPVDSAYPLQAIAESDEPSTSHGLAGNNVEVTRHIRSSEKSDIYEGDLSDIERIVLRGDGLTHALTKEKAEFIIDTSEVSREGRITCALTGQKADVPIRLGHLGNNVYKATYTPLISGTYELQVLWDGEHVNGSPFRVFVDQNVSVAELIHVDTSTLKIGIINEDIKTLIDTRRAGPGQLSAQCMGPNKLAYCELYDHRDGTYTLSIKPSEIGKHNLVIKYSNEHVPGSPFTINVSHPPDASKVRVFGPGIEHGILSTFKSNFVVETKGAGAGQLTVRVRGPKGAFNVEMLREKKQERTIHCKYEPKEPGDYQVEVKWHGEHVPGSPFLVMIVDTEQELERFLRGSAPSPQPATPFIPPGWIGTPPPPLFLTGPPAPSRGRYPPPPPHLAPPPSHGMVPYVPPPLHAMRSSARSRYTNGY